MEMENNYSVGSEIQWGFKAVFDAEASLTP